MLTIVIDQRMAQTTNGFHMDYKFTTTPAPAAEYERFAERMSIHIWYRENFIL